MAETDRKRILVVDDEPEVRRVYKELLEQHGYHVDTAASGKEAWKASNAIAYDLVHMDISMPDWDGMDAIVSMTLSKSSIPILVVSGFLTEDVIKEIDGEPNVKGYMEKPTDPEAYLRAVRSILDRPEL